MASVDLTKMCRDWYERQPEYRSNAAINLQNIVIKKEQEARWTSSVPVAQAQKGPVRKATVKFNRSMQDILSKLEISKESETVADVTLTTGIVKGLGEKSIVLSPPAEAISGFCGSILVKPGKTRTESKDSKPLVTQESEYQPPMRGAGAIATANIISKESCYKGRFEIILSLDGDVIFSSGDEQNIREIIRDVQSSERNVRQPFFMQNSNGFTYWTVTGDAELHWDEPDVIEWTNS